MTPGKAPLTILFVMSLPSLLKPLFQKDRGKPMGIAAVYKLLEGLVEAGHNVHFASIVDPAREKVADLEDRSRDIFISGVHFHVIKMPYGRLSLVLQGRKPLSRPLGYCRSIFKLAFCLWRLSRLISKIKPDVIYAAMGYQFTGGLIGKIRGIPTVIRIYGTFRLHDLRGSWRAFFLQYSQIILSFKLPSARFIITNDGTRGDKVAKFYGVPEHRLKFWINGVDKTIYQPYFDRQGFLSTLGIPASKKVVLSLCRLMNFHRIDSLIRAVPQVVEEVDNVVFLIVGDGPERSNLEELSRQLKVDRRVKFVGFVPHGETHDFFNAADLFVSLYDFSNLCNPVLEAMACGKCIVSLDDGTLEGLIKNGDSGRLVEPELVEAELPGILVNLLNDDLRRQQLGSKARESVMKNLESWEERIGKEIRLIDEIASAKR
ncbi:glycosyltransferase family 4 protein [Chloroflexota bacterium]